MLIGGDNGFKSKNHHTSVTFYDDNKYGNEHDSRSHSTSMPRLGQAGHSMDLLEYINQQNTSAQNHLKPHIEKRVDKLSPYFQIKKKTFMKNYNLNTI